MPAPAQTSLLADDDARLLDEAWRDEIRPAVARHLLIAAVLEFAARGYHATTTRDVARRAGLSPAGVYVHYRSKEELLYRSSLIGHQHAVAMINTAAATTDDPVGRLRAVVSRFAEWHARYHTAARVNQYEIGALSEEHHKEIAALRRDIDAVMRDTLRHGVAHGVFAVTDVPGTALALLSLAIDVTRWYRPAGHRAPEEIGALYADLAERMVRAAPNRRPPNVGRLA
jgi:AcrR family transcriptional regulator